MSHVDKKSPSQTKVLKLTFDRELHFGPFVFSVEIEGFSLERKLGYITDDLCWSEDERFLALVEIIFNHDKNSNISNLNLVDAKVGTIKLVDSKNGLIKPKSVSNTGTILY